MSIGDEVVELRTVAVHIAHGDGAATVRLVGTLAAPDLADLRQALWPLIARYDGSMVTFDCAGLERVDDPVVALFGQFGRAITPGRPVLLAPSPAVARSLTEAGLAGYFDIEGAVAR